MKLDQNQRQTDSPPRAPVKVCTLPEAAAVDEAAAAVVAAAVAAAAVVAAAVAAAPVSAAPVTATETEPPVVLGIGLPWSSTASILRKV